MAHKNILMIIADDLGYYTRCYGAEKTTTPRIDALAAQGVKFDLAFASTASCSGSRSVMYTGLHTHENGQYGLVSGSTFWQTFDKVDSGARLFNQAGYLTGIVGKIHVGNPNVYNWTYNRGSNIRDSWKLGEQCDEFFVQAKKEDKPFFLTVGFTDPHRDQSRGGFGNALTYDPRVKDIEVQPEDVEVPIWISDVPELREELCQYYRAIYRFDQGVGFILDNLQKQGLEDSTMVLLCSDNGPPFVNSKATLFDSGTRLPFIIRAPGCAKGITNPNMVSYIDILPTYLDWAGLPLDMKTREDALSRIGRSILPVLNRGDIVPESEWQHHIFGSHTFHQREHYWPTRCIRTRKYKYHRNITHRLDFPIPTDLYASLSYEGIRNMGRPVMIGPRSLKDYLFRPAEQLFDLESDPQEVKDLAKDPAHAEVLQELRKKLESWQKVTYDYWLWRDGQSLTQINEWVTDKDFLVPDRFDMDPEVPETRGQVEGLNLLKAGGAVPGAY